LGQSLNRFCRKREQPADEVLLEPLFVQAIADLPQAAIDNAQAGDVLLCMGAGSIGHVPARLVELLQSAERLALEEQRL
jgi:UDP-N-acetylmuramate--alanine ligase